MPLILRDFECVCGRVYEELTTPETEAIGCVVCGREAKKIFSVGHGHYREDAPWIETVREIVDKESTKAHVREFLASPTRENWRKWKAGEGLREYCEGERAIVRERQDTKKIADRLMQRHMERKALVIR